MTDDKYVSFPVPLDAQHCLNVIWQWIEDDTSWDNVEHEQWEGNLEHDGSNSKGWRVYVESRKRV